MKRSSITAAYVANESERYVVTVKVAAAYPDALDEARAQAVRGVSELLATAIAMVQAGEASDDEQ